MSETESAEYDVIVVGTGTSGSIVARRLVDAGRRVLVLEAGGEDTNPAIHDISRLAEIWHSSDDWDYFTTPQEHAAGRRLHLPRGKVLGGSHALNATIWVRGAREDYDGWAAEGNDGWAWDDVEPVFRRIENYRPQSAGRGDDGLLDVIGDYPLTPIQSSIIAAAEQIGLPRNDDYNLGEQDGVAQQQVTLGDSRINTYIAYLKPVRDAENLTLLTGAWVHRVLLEGDRAVGVVYERDGATHEARAAEVVLSAGALDSPRILLLSGIGPAEHLAEVGIKVAHDLPGVGENLHDHLLSPVIFTTTAKPIDPPTPNVSVTQSHLFWKSKPELEVPDTQPINFSVPMYEPWMTGPPHGFSLMAGIVSPKSRGTLRLADADPHTPALIDIAALEHPDDGASLVASVEQCREIGRAAALAGEEWGSVELYPGPDETDVEGWVRRTAITYHHQVGTCRMGSGPDAVVDARLRVHGIAGLRVIDASIMPTITTGNTNAPAALIGERGAEFLLDPQL